MAFQGVVTDVNKTFLFFKLNNRIKVHMSILLTQNVTQKLPKVGSRVTVKNAHRRSASYSVCKSSNLDGDFTVEYDRNFFYGLVNDCKLGFRDLHKVDKIIDLINSYTDLSEDLKISLIKSILQYITEGLNNIFCEEHVCLNKQISSLNFITVSKCRYTQIQKEGNNFAKFPYWSHGVHLKPRRSTILFGYIMVQPGYGFLVIKDQKNYQMPCVIHSAKPYQIQSVENAYVLIKNYRVFTEMFNEDNVPNIEYLVIDYNDVHVIYKEKNTDYRFGKVVPTHEFKHNISFQLVRKSMVCIGDNKKPECWFQILVKTPTSTPREIFLILPCVYMKIVMYFEEGQNYRLFYNQTLKETDNTELERMKNIKIYELRESHAFFQRLTRVFEPKKHLTVKECREFVTNRRDLVSFEGVLTTRKFADAFKSRTPKKSDVYGFGMPGSKVHQLIFTVTENGQQFYLDCYMNNWENILIPLGLIPQMKLIVRNVYPQSKKYLKATVFTTFEVVAYTPLIDFNTVNLFENVDFEWGKEFYLGHGNKIPHGVLMWGKTYNAQILIVRMETLCSNCKLTNEQPGPCIACRGDTKDFNFLVKMHVTDEHGQSKILVKFPEIMKIILNLEEYEFQRWLKRFKEIGFYEYNFYDHDKPKHVLERDSFKVSITKHLKNINKKGMLFMDLKCRKLDNNTHSGRPVWYCIDARRS